MALSHKIDDELINMPEEELVPFYDGTSFVIFSGIKNKFSINDITTYTNRIQAKINGEWEEIDTVYEIVDGVNIYHFPSYPVVLLPFEIGKVIKLAVDDKEINYNPLDEIIELGNYANGTYTLKYQLRGAAEVEETFTVSNSALSIREVTPVLGVSWASNASSSVLTRTDGSVGKVSAETKSTIETAFNSLYPYSQMKRVALNSAGAVVGYHEPSNTNLIRYNSEPDTVVNLSTDNWATYIAAGYNCMVQIPKVYYKRTIAGNTWTFQISSYPCTDFKLFPNFYESDGTTEKDYVYFSAFEGVVISSKLRSLPSKTPTADMNFPSFVSAATAMGTNYRVTSGYDVGLLQWLFIIEYANLNSQSFYAGVHSSSLHNTGLVTTGNYSGIQSADDDGTKSFSYRGVENLYGNIFKWTSGITKEGANPQHWVIAGTNTSIDAVKTGSGAYFSTIVSDPKMDFIFMPSNSSGGSESTYFCDSVWSDPTANIHVPLFGGFWDVGLQVGVFFWYLNYAGSDGGSDVGARAAL